MSLTPNTETEGKSPEEAFRVLRDWVDGRLRAKRLLPGALSPVRTRHETPTVTLADIERLKADIATLIKLEGRRSFWEGIAVNAFFFVLGLIAGALSL